MLMKSIDINKSLYALVLLTFFGAFQSAHCAGFVHASGREILDGQGNKVLRRGMGLGGWLVPEGYMLHFPGIGSPTGIRHLILDVAGPAATLKFYEQYEANYVTRDDIQMLGEWGFDHIRLPFHYNQFSSSIGVWNEKGFAIVDSMINWCREANILLVLDMHCAPGAQNEGPISDSDGNANLWLSSAYQDHAVAIWKEIARRYSTEEQIAGYDLLNEPVLPGGVSVQQFRNLYIRLVNAVREVDQNHLVFIEGNWYATDFNGLTPPFDSNMAYNFHKYWSVNDQASIRDYVKLRSDYNVPLWMSESGENSNQWFYEATQLFEENNIGWCWWTHKKFDTITSPLSATMPEAMDVLFDYWNAELQSQGSGTKPSQPFAEAVLMQMAEALKTENCVPRPGVIPALFDDEYGTTSKPFKGHLLPGSIKAIDYDIGALNIAYSDKDYANFHWDQYSAWNTGYQYRNDGVDIEYNSQSELYNVGWIESGEWLKYSVLLSHDGVFDVDLEISGATASGDISLELDGNDLGSFSASSTVNQNSWHTVSLKDQLVYHGEHVLKITFNRGGVNFRNLKVVEDVNSTREHFPVRFELGQNYPNPFNDGTIIPVQINRAKDLHLIILDMLGREMQRYDLSGKVAGLAKVSWDGMTGDGLAAPAGVYYYRLENGEEAQAGKMLYLR